MRFLHGKKYNIQNHIRNFKFRILRRGVIDIGDLHIYQIEGMEEYLPKKGYLRQCMKNPIIPRFIK